MSSSNPRQVIPGSDPSHAFSRVAQADIQRSAFDLSHGVKTTLDTDLLYPFTDFEVVPGDTLTVSPTLVAQMLTLKQQLMDSLYMDLHWWFVPYRLLYPDWVKLQGEQDDPNDTIDYTTPQVVAPTVGGWAEGSIYDYFGWPTKVAGPLLTANAWLPRAYNLIYKTWYRDQNLIDSPIINTGAGPDAVTDTFLVRRGKRKDYFTSCLPWPQKGDAVTLPLGGSAPVAITLDGPNTNPVLFKEAAAGHALIGDSEVKSANGLGSAIFGDTGGGGGPAAVFDPNGSLTGLADLSAATAVTINALRQAITIQQLLERDARGGTRYTEIIHSHFGVTSPDARLQRPEFLGGGTVPVVIHSVVNTNQLPSGGSPLGNRAAFGHLQSNGGLGFTQSFTEHGVVLGIVSIRQEYTYQQGLARRHSRQTRYDYYMPTFANLGEQAVLQKEILAQGTASDALVFGYQERWGEMRCQLSMVTGKFRSNATGSLDVWHLSQVLSPNMAGEFPLTQDFIEENVPIDRVVNVPSEPIFQLDSFISCRAVRPMPIFSTPGLRVL